MSEIPTTVIGIDCATEAKKVGLALALFSSGRLAVSELTCGGTAYNLLNKVRSWVAAADRVLLALDAPLGWPNALAAALGGHKAGDAIQERADDLFRRLTDRAVTETCKRRPLDVGADRIARTAHAALKLLGELRSVIGQPIPLAWSPQFAERVAAIEVYPAATLAGRRIQCSQYKKPSDVESRKTMVTQLSSHMQLPTDVEPLLRYADILDASVCALAAADFLRGDVLQPSDNHMAQREGWIWAKVPA
jgi:predicted RNase H-like nuclease